MTRSTLIRITFIVIALAGLLALASLAGAQEDPQPETPSDESAAQEPPACPKAKAKGCPHAKKKAAQGGCPYAKAKAAEGGCPHAKAKAAQNIKIKDAGCPCQTGECPCMKGECPCGKNKQDCPCAKGECPCANGGDCPCAKGDCPCNTDGNDTPPCGCKKAGAKTAAPAE